jgi:hypothetical protein
MEHNNTPIEQWIEESNPYDSQVPVKAFNYGCNKLLTYLGLQDLSDPKKWLEEMKFEISEWNLYAKSVDEQIIDRNSLIDKLMAENNQYKKAIAEQAIDYQKTIDKLDAEIIRLKELG